MVAHKEFQNAGKQPGLQIWRIENMDLKPVPKNLYGNFFTGDAYILLHTTQAPSYKLHMWLGEECSQDESGAAAIFATQLDDYLGGKPVQCREVQNYESLSFVGYFRSGIKYQKGGVASGFQHVVTNEMNAKRLLHVKGRITIRATEVEMSWKSFNKGDCFIIDLGKNIYQWCGSECNRYERLKASEVAIGIRDNERNGRGKISMLEEGDEPEEVISVLGPKPAIAPATPDSEVVETVNRKKASLWMISDATGSMKTSQVAASSPFKQEMLSTSECYILDNGVDGKIFLWKGKGANPEERKSAMKTAEAFIKEKNYPKTTQIQIFPQGGETTLFKQFFSNWKDKDQTEGPSEAYVVGKIAKIKQIPFDASTLHSDKAMAAQHGMVDDGAGKVEIWRVEGGDMVHVEPSTYGQFFGGDCYLILYSYKTGGREQHLIYTWQGLKCTKDELTASAFLTVKLDDSMGGSPVQVAACASSLNTNDVFVLKAPDAVYVWKGVGATDEEMVAAKHVLSLLGGKSVEIAEGKEPGSLTLIEPGPVITEFERKVYEEGLKMDLSAADKETANMFTNIYLKNYNQIFQSLGQSPEDIAETNKLYTPMTTLKYADPNGDLPIDTFYKMVFEHDKIFNASLSFIKMLRWGSRKSFNLRKPQP
ncbi:UNVERIFIED_CONTAM: hypothetical protein FKN15_049432 [Acipenser sinensis]